jgi:hypothetical protein
MPSSKSPPEDRESSEEEGDNDEEEGDSENEVPEDRETSEEEEDDEEPDIRNQFLPELFRPKPVKSHVTSFMMDLRTPLLGLPLLKLEKTKLMDTYFCPDADYQEFSAPTIHGK